MELYSRRSVRPHTPVASRVRAPRPRSRVVLQRREQGTQGVGFFSVAGCKSVGDDLFIGREALLKAGLQETKAGSNVFRFGTATERRASAAKYAAPGSGEEEA